MGYQRRVHGDSIAKTFHQSKKMKVLLILLITLAVCTMHTYAAPKTFLIETADAGLDYGGRPNDLDMAGDDYGGRPNDLDMAGDDYWWRSDGFVSGGNLKI